MLVFQQWNPASYIKLENKSKPKRTSVTISQCKVFKTQSLPQENVFPAWMRLHILERA